MHWRACLCNLRKRTNDIRFQLELDKQLKLEEEKLLRASMELREANMTSAARKARDEEVHRGQLLLSPVVCREWSPDWRADATAEFRNRKLEISKHTPTMTTIISKALIRNLIETQYMDFDDVLVINNPQLDGTIENVSNWIVSYRWNT
jgi:hypothetical protein